MKSAIRFLTRIYSQQCQNGDYVILSVKGPGIPWRDISLKYGPNFKVQLQKFFKQYSPQEFDLYWSPMPYSGPKRRLENALDTKFLAQDIDEHDNPTEIDPPPSYLWESSPNKYQGLWELDRYIEHEQYTPLNKALSTYISEEAECFDFTHVYRIPGTKNHKYKNSPEVALPQTSKKIYKPKKLSQLLKVNTSKPVEKVTTNGDLTERKIYAKYSIPQKVRDLLALDDISELDRSSTIWYIENKLHELGMTPNEIIHLVRNSSFNKYKGRADEERRLRQELDKIISGKITHNEKEEEQPGLKISTFENVMGNHNTLEGWLVKGFWGRRSHGMVAGMPKCFKSTLVHDFVVSVASGEPFLGKYPVLEPGPVIVVQNENSDYIMKDRTEKLLLHRGLEGKAEKKGKDKIGIEFPEELPITFINQQGFVLSNEDHRKQLEEIIKQVKPMLVVLDPLYLMFEGDLNSAKELNPVLNWLLYLKNEYKTSVMVIHHYNKGGMNAGKGGSRMMGSIILYGWIESAWYLSKEEELEEDPEGNISESRKEPTTITMNREFRMSGSFPGIDIHLKMGEIGDPHYNVDVSISGQKPVKVNNVKDDILNLLETSNVPLTRRKITEHLGINRKKTKEILELLIKDKRIVALEGGYTVYKGYQN